MTGDPHWHIDIDIYGDEDITFARATLTAHHAVLMGQGTSRTRTCTSADRLTGDAAAVSAALQDLAHQLAGAPHRRHTPPAHLTAPRSPHRKAREHGPSSRR